MSSAVKYVFALCFLCSVLCGITGIKGTIKPQIAAGAQKSYVGEESAAVCAEQIFSQALREQNIDFRNAAFGIVGAGAWPGTVKSWGLRRVWLQPDADTNTYGRTNLSIHGGLSKGSRGCIDIPWQTNQLSNFMNGCPNSIPVYVKYTKESW